MTTLKDVAKKANVSACTVSRYLNANIVVKRDTERRIKEAIKELGYVPNVVAKSLRRKHTSNVAVILPSINHLYYSEITSGISGILAGQGYSLYIYELDNLQLSEDEILQQMRENMVAGIIFIGVFSDRSFLTSIQKAIKWKLPVAYTNRCIDYSGFPLLYPDLKKAIKLGVDYLFKKGRQHIAFIHDDMSVELLSSLYGCNKYDNGDKRYPSIIDLKANVTIDAQIKTILKQHADGIFVHNELTAIHLTKAIIQMGIRVPEDIAVLSLGNSLMSEISTPRLSCIDLQNKQLGMKSAEVILSQIQQQPFNNVIEIEPTIIERESV